MLTKTVEEETGEFTVSDELYQITEATNRDGTVDVQIYDWEKIEVEGEPMAKVWFYTPSMEQRWETMPWPTMDTLDNKFVRICESCGVGLKGADWLKTDGATIRADPGSWTIQPSLPRRYKAKRFVDGLTLQDLVATGLFVVGVGIVVLAVIGVFGVPIYGVLTIAGNVPPAPVGPFGWAIIWMLSFVVISIAGESTEV